LAYDRRVWWRNARSLFEEVQLRVAISAHERRVRRRKARSPDRIMQKLTLGEYRELLAGVPTPSREQMEGFARFVSTAHSWYKHLPLLPPGIPMTFFLDPGAGTQRIVDRRGRMQQVDRLKSGFHYSWLPTAEYRDRFGHPAFARTAGTVVTLIGADGSELVPPDNQPALFEPGRAELVSLPNEVLEAGVAYVSGVIHTRASYPVLWQLPKNRDASGVDWPAEVLAQIRERVRALSVDPQLIEPPPDPADEGDLDDEECDLVLHRLLTAEGERQLRSIVAALERVVDLVR
jgi:hypothetical protein